MLLGRLVVGCFSAALVDRERATNGPQIGDQLDKSDLVLNNGLQRLYHLF
jgi:hypothetical protein